MMVRKLRVAVVGAGRMGALHARHVRDLAAEGAACELSLVVDVDQARATGVAQELRGPGAESVRPGTCLDSVQQGSIDAAIVATPPQSHAPIALRLAGAGLRLLMEKPLTAEPATDRDLCRVFKQRGHNVMMAFQRRYDPALCHARAALQSDLIGPPFKIVSVLEDSHPPPHDVLSPGILMDMSVHNVDEVIWLADGMPTGIHARGTRFGLHGPAYVQEEFDDAHILMDFPGGLQGHVQVSRNHVAGYHAETRIYGPRGMIHVGRFRQDPFNTDVVVYGPGTVIDQATFPLPDYGPRHPEFVQRFCLAYKAQVADFLHCCIQQTRFPVTQADALRAMEVVAAASDQLHGRTGGDEPPGDRLRGATDAVPHGPLRTPVRVLSSA